MSTVKPLVSIGIPTYNRPLGLSRILHEIINQTYCDIEIIVSDNYSAGCETENIVREIMQKDTRIQYFKQAQNIGSFNNYKFLLEKAKGEYFMWVCDDDFRDPEYVESCVQEFKALKTPILINSHSARLNSRGEVVAIDQGCTTIGMLARDRYVKYISTIFTKQAAVGDVLYGVMNREILLNAMSEQLNIIAWDHTLLARLAFKGEFYTIPRKLMSAAEAGLSSTIENTAKAQLISGSLSEKMPIWVRETYLQQVIKHASNINGFEKLYLSIWSYGFYFATCGFKMWVKSVSPGFFNFLKNMFQFKFEEHTSSSE
jgi:glycosyltransferase involved in cell wall biosynthesis